MKKSSAWQLWIDTGGTFTDCIARTPSGELRRLKILSSSVLRGSATGRINDPTIHVDMAWPGTEDIFKDFTFRIVGQLFSTRVLYVDIKNNLMVLQEVLPHTLRNVPFEITTNEEVPLLAARLLTATPLHKKFPPLEMKLGSTRGTNAILERKGARTALLVTKGFKDLLLIGNQQRPDLFALQVIKTKPLYDCVLEVEERIEANGAVLQLLEPASINLLQQSLKKNRIESVAIALLNSYKNPTHEILLADALRAHGFEFVSVSSALSSQMKILPRAETAVANAYLDPIIETYVHGIQHGLSRAPLHIMTSAGSLVRANSFFPKDSLLSGPAGGVVGAAQEAKRSGIKRIIAFDMGGTSTDVSLYDNRFDYRFESKVGTFKILSPSLAIETIAAGGGSICDFDGHRFTVGPHSAGAYPGPACYGAHGPLTITDVNVLLGRLDPENFPIPILFKESQIMLERLLAKVKRITGRNVSAEQVLESLVQIANEKMAEAIKKISVQQGHDPREFALLSFGGAGGQHACALAEILNMRQVLVPYDAGLLSASGIGHASIERFEERLILQPWNKFSSEAASTCQELFGQAKARLLVEGFSEKDIVWKKTLLFLRFAGQDSSIEIDYRPGDAVLKRFREKYTMIFGHWVDRSVEIESIRIIASVEPLEEIAAKRKFKLYQPVPVKSMTMICGGKKRKGHVFRWEALTPGAQIEGPALIISGNSTTFVEQHWKWVLDAVNNAHLHWQKSARSSIRTTPEALLELFTNRFTALALEMGALLQRTSFSVNVKERLDFSCAVLDPDGYLVVNAPHIPVHLGSMGVCVREVCKAIKMKQGDVIITNHPAFGGSHLPDVTLIKPVFYKKKLVGFVANRAHHAEIGGKKPGSMPADATRLEEEGVIIAPMYLIKRGKPHWEAIKSVLTKAAYPTRAIEENLADLNGALAAVNLGEKGLQELCRLYTAKEVVNQMHQLHDHAAVVLRRKIRTLPKKLYTASERLDDGSLLRVKITRRSDRLTIDFTGSSQTHPGNLNATNAIVQSVILYSLRLLVNQPLPMNEGLMEPVTLILPTGLLNPDFSKTLPAVVGGNTEVSQRLTDTILKAFELSACSQGTMNNFLFGNARFGYYETICGGTGAGYGFHGTDAVHQHMTNTRITDPELMEFRYPVRLNRFEIRRGSGGKGKWKGGEGIEREIFFKKTLEINLLTQHRNEQPYGLHGGGAGKVGQQILVRASSKEEKLKGMDSCTVNEGDTIIIKTPGGGAWGRDRQRKGNL